MTPKSFDPCNTDRARPNPRPCLWCAGLFKAKKIHEDFCSADHRRAFNNWRRKEGAKVFDLMLKFRGERTAGSFGAMCAVIDRAVAQQKDRWAKFEKERATRGKDAA